MTVDFEGGLIFSDGGLVLSSRGGAGARPGRDACGLHMSIGYTTLLGAQVRYALHDRNGRPLAMIGFSTAAWKLAPPDTFIGSRAPRSASSAIC